MKKSTLNTPIERFTRMMFTRIIGRLAQFLQAHNFTMTQIAALHIVYERESIGVLELAEELKLSKSATSRMVDELVKKDLFLRTEDEVDRRIKTITISKEGHELLDAMSIERVDIIMEVAGNIPAKISKGILGAVKMYRPEKESK